MDALTSLEGLPPGEAPPVPGSRSTRSPVDHAGRADLPDLPRHAHADGERRPLGHRRALDRHPGALAPDHHRQPLARQRRGRRAAGTGEGGRAVRCARQRSPGRRARARGRPPAVRPSGEGGAEGERRGSPGRSGASGEPGTAPKLRNPCGPSCAAPPGCTTKTGVHPLARPLHSHRTKPRSQHVHPLPHRALHRLLRPRRGGLARRPREPAPAQHRELRPGLRPPPGDRGRGHRAPRIRAAALPPRAAPLAARRSDRAGRGPSRAALGRPGARAGLGHRRAGDRAPRARSGRCWSAPQGLGAILFRSEPAPCEAPGLPASRPPRLPSSHAPPLHGISPVPPSCAASPTPW